MSDPLALTEPVGFAVAVASLVSGAYLIVVYARQDHGYPVFDPLPSFAVDEQLDEAEGRVGGERDD